jgi:hypothetical protein
MAASRSLKKPSSPRFVWAKSRAYPLADAGSRQATEGQYGSVSIPQEAFIAALRMGEE